MDRILLLIELKMLVLCMRNEHGRKNTFQRYPDCRILMVSKDTQRPYILEVPSHKSEYYPLKNAYLSANAKFQKCKKWTAQLSISGLRFMVLFGSHILVQFCSLLILDMFSYWVILQPSSRYSRILAVHQRKEQLQLKISKNTLLTIILSGKLVVCHHHRLTSHEPIESLGLATLVFLYKKKS